MSNLEFHVFKRNTDAIATNRGFYYQYLKTIKLWIDNYKNKKEIEIYCEREDDIFQFNEIKREYKFHQIKCYAEGFGLNSPEIKSSLLNFFNLFLKYKDDYTGYFYFETNSTFKPNAGKSLKKWFENQDDNNYSIKDVANETKKYLKEQVEENLRKFIQKKPSTKNIERAKENVSDFINKLNSDEFESFLKVVRWKFGMENDTEKATSKLLTEISTTISSFNLDIRSELFLGYLLHIVIEKSIHKNESERFLNNTIFQEILANSNLDELIESKLRPELISLMNNHIQVTEKLDDIKETIEKTEKKITEIYNASSKKNNYTKNLADEVKNWLIALNYSFEDYREDEENTSKFILNIPKRRGYDRVFILCVSESVEINHLDELNYEYKKHDCDEGWIITYRRISNTVRKKVNKGKYKELYSYTLDELIDEHTDFSDYFKWLEDEVILKKINTNYISLRCKKDLFDESHNKIDSNEYKVESYINKWIDDPSKNHISILGEFGTGKTWLTLHFAWRKLVEYKKAKKKGLLRGRIPIIIPLRDFAKSVSIEGVFSEFFFKKYNSPIPTYKTFEVLNRMGKLLLIFDGFDEMADKIDSQKMINNFWELAKTVTENSKVILTCRNEHFPEAKRGRELLNAELKASTQNLIIETPKFEILELLKFDKKQIKKLLKLYTSDKIIKKIFKSDTLIDLASRPIMTELIIESLDDIEKGKEIDISRIYLYAITKKFNKDILEKRTFTSISDKLYFMAEISWEMLSTDNMSINYRLFPDRIRKLFGKIVEEEKDIDHWQYDMMGQTLLVRTDDGDYKPSHRSLLEFFVVYKFASELGVLNEDFKNLAVNIKSSGSTNNLKDFYWNEYFQNSDKNNLLNFKRISIQDLKDTFGKKVISKAELDLMINMISISSSKTQKSFNQIIDECRNKTFDEVGYIVTNLIIILVTHKYNYFDGKDLSNLSITNLNMPKNFASNNFQENKMSFVDTKFIKSDLTNSNIMSSFFGKLNDLKKADFTNANLTNFNFQKNQINDLSILDSKNLVILGSPDLLTILNKDTLNIVNQIVATGWHTIFSNDGKYLIHSGYGSVVFRNTKDFEIEFEYKLSNQCNSSAQENGENLWTGGFVVSKDNSTLYVACNNAFVYVFDIIKKKEKSVYKCDYSANKLKLSSCEKYLICTEHYSINIWNLETKEKVINTSNIKINEYGITHSDSHPFDSTIAILIKNCITFLELPNKNIVEINFDSKITDICFSKDCMFLYVIDREINIFMIDYKTKIVTKTLKVEANPYYKATIYLDESNNDLIYILIDNSILLFNLKKEKVMDSYISYFNMTDIIFTSVKGIKKSIQAQLEKNGAKF